MLSYQDALSTAQAVIAKKSNHKKVYEFEEKAQELAIIYLERAHKTEIKYPYAWMMLASMEVLYKGGRDYQYTDIQLREYEAHLDTTTNKPTLFNYQTWAIHLPLTQLFIILTEEGRANPQVVEDVLKKLIRPRGIKCSTNILSPRHGLSDKVWLQDSFDLVHAHLDDINLQVYDWGISTDDTNPEEWGCYQRKTGKEIYYY